MVSSLVTDRDHAGRSRRRSVRLAILAIAAGLIASMLAVPQIASARPVRSALAHSRQELYAIGAVGRLINRERQAHGLAAVRLNHDLALSARRHDLDMAAFNEMSHQLPGEAFFADRMTAAGYHWSWAGENIGWNSDMSTAGVLELERLMYAEQPPNDGHRLNILGRHYRDVGIDVYYDYAHHKVWLTTDFGHH